MTQNKWTAIDRYIEDQLLPSEPVFNEVLDAAAKAGLPPHNVSPSQGKLLQLLAQTQGARTILEIGTLAGYSTIWLARALPAGGSLITLEADPNHAAVARENIARADLSNVVEIRIGLAVDSLSQLAAEARDPFDLIFIDADKRNNPQYLEWALKLSRPGTLIIADNVVRSGAVLDHDSDDPTVTGIRRFIELLGADPRVNATAIQTVGSKGHDGIAIALVTGDT